MLFLFYIKSYFILFFLWCKKAYKIFSFSTEQKRVTLKDEGKKHQEYEIKYD